MKIQVPLLNRTIELAEKPKPAKGGKMTDEVGVAGDVVFNGFKDEEARSDKITIKQYREMLDKDPTVESLFNIFTLPIIAATYRIDADKNDTGEVQAEFVRRNLLEPPHKGGMETPMSLFLDQLLMSVVDGFQLWEKVYRIDEAGRLALKKLAHRDSIGITLKRDKYGGYGGAVQRVNYMGEWKEIELLAYKTFLFTHNKARDFLYGRSSFRSLYPKYDKKRRLEYLDSIALQNDAIKPKVLLRKESGALGKEEKTARNKALAMLAKLGERKPVASLPYGYDIKELNSQGRDPHTSIERQNSEMARAFLATFALLGSQGKESNVGSYALSDNLADMLMISLKAYMTKVEEHINQYLIADLIDLNFAEKHYPEFHFDDITSDVVEVMTDAFQKLLEKDRISDEMVEGIERATANRLEIDLEKIKKDRKKRAEEEAKEAAKSANNESGNDDEGSSAGNSGGKFLSDGQRWWRPLTPAEQTVRLADIEKRMDNMEDEFIGRVEPVLKSYLESLTNSEVESGNVGVELPKDYIAAVSGTIRTAYNYAKTGAADELKVAAPATSKEAIESMKQFTDFVINKQQDDLKNILIAEKLKHQRLTRSLAEGEEEEDPNTIFKTSLQAAFTAWLARILRATASSIVATSVANGRGDVFDDVAGKDDLFQLSGILDEKICPMCEELDGSVVTRDEYRRTRWKPPFHFNCRCLWILVRKVSPDYKMPEVTGLPLMAGGEHGPKI